MTLEEKGRSIVETVTKMRAIKTKQETLLSELSRQGNLMLRGVDPKDVSRPVFKDVVVVVEVNTGHHGPRKRKHIRQRIVAVILKDGSEVSLDPVMTPEEWRGSKA